MSHMKKDLWSLKTNKNLIIIINQYSGVQWYPWLAFPLKNDCSPFLCTDAFYTVKDPLTDDDPSNMLYDGKKFG